MSVLQEISELNPVLKHIALRCQEIKVAYTSEIVNVELKWVATACRKSNVHVHSMVHAG
jgi:hypothetical protein